MQTMKPADPVTLIPEAAEYSDFCQRFHAEPDTAGRTIEGNFPHAHLLALHAPDSDAPRNEYLVRGQTVRIVRGRKVAKGTEGIVKWIGERPAFSQSHYGKPRMETRIGLDVGSEKLVYVAAEYVVIVGEAVPFVRPAVKCPVCGEERPDYPTLNAHRAEAHPRPSGPTVTIREGVAYTFGGKKYLVDCAEHGTVLPKTVTWLARAKTTDEHGRDKWIDEERLYALPQCSVCGATDESKIRVRVIQWTARSSGQTRCDGRCTGAEGDSCDCFCGGECHGRGACPGGHAGF